MRRLTATSSLTALTAGLALIATVGVARPAHAYDPQHTHRWITRQAIAKLVAQYPGQYDELLEYADEVALGVEDEDDPLLDGDSDPTTLRVMRHFFRPTDGMGLFMLGQQFPSSYAWGAIPNETNAWDWGDGMRHFSSGDKVMAYRVLGHMVHLIQDATVPAHTHLDIHGPPSGDDYEGYCSRQTTDEFSSTLPLPDPAIAVPLWSDPYDAWSATATASYERNFYPGDLSNQDGGAQGVIAQMFPDLEWSWFFEDWRGSVGVLGSDFFEQAPGWFYFKNAELPAAFDKMADGFGPNTTGAPMVELFARDLIPIAILHSAGVMKLYLDEAYSQPLDPPVVEDPPATGEDYDQTSGCEVSHSDRGQGAPVSLALLSLLYLLWRRK